MGKRTSARQRTLAPLKSWLSNLSTATLRSPAVSNSTNLKAVNEDMALNGCVNLTLYHRGRGQPRSRRRQAQSDVQSL